MNGFTHTFKISFDLRIWKAQNIELPHIPQLPGLCEIRLLSLTLIMLPAVQLYNKPGFMAVKIHNIGAKYLLPVEWDRIRPQKVIPKMIFLSRGMFPKPLRKGARRFLTLYVAPPSPHPPLRGTFPPGEGLIDPPGQRDSSSGHGQRKESPFYKPSRMARRFWSYSSWVINPCS